MSNLETALESTRKIRGYWRGADFDTFRLATITIEAIETEIERQRQAREKLMSDLATCEYTAKDRNRSSLARATAAAQAASFDVALVFFPYHEPTTTDDQFGVWL